MRTSVALTCILAYAALAGCAMTLKPAPEAQLAGGNEQVAIGRAQGIELVLEPDAWHAFPQALDEHLTPMREPAGQVSGFLYFPELDATEEGDQVTFAAALVDARLDQEFGRISIPLVVD